MAEQIEHAYATTVHKAQGSEFDIIILPLLFGLSPFLTRNLLYTALTRAKKKVYLLGTEKTIRHMVDNDKISLRYTILKRELIELGEIFSMHNSSFTMHNC
jgi:exodeoxyribonuclease V alpha subunit